MRNTFAMTSTNSGPSAVQTMVVTELGVHREAWDALVDAQRLPSPFLKSWWIENAAAGTTAIVLVTREGTLVGGAAFEVTSWGPERLGIEKVTVVGGELLAADHIDLISTAADRAAVTRAVLGYLLRRGNRLLDLQGLATDGTLARALSDAEYNRHEAPYAPLPERYDEYLAARPGKVRSTIKRRGKQLATAGARVVPVDPGDLDRVIEVFAELHDTRWADESGFLAALERFTAVVRAGVARGEVLLTELRLDSGPTVAIEVDFEVAGRLSFYQSGRRTDHDWRGCGTVLRSAIIEAAVGRGIREYDLLRGEEDYKAEWATARRQLSDCRLPVGPGAKALAFVLSRAPWPSRR